MLYRIVNMSDPYTIECPDLEIAAMACVLLGQGQYAFEPIDGESDEVPLFFGGADEWFTEKFGQTAQQMYHWLKGNPDRCAQLADALDWVVIGDESDRDLFQLALDYVPDANRDEFRAAWHDKKRSSLNDIGGRARAIAARLRTGQPAVLPAPKQVFTS